jgi:hypothetical protein
MCAGQFAWVNDTPRKCEERLVWDGVIRITGLAQAGNIGRKIRYQMQPVNTEYQE